LKRPLRIGINAQIPSDSGAGGIETVLRVLTSLNRFGGDEEYVFIGHWKDADWLEPLLSERQILVRAPNPGKQFKPTGTENLKRLLGGWRPLARRAKNIVLPAKAHKPLPSVPISDGFFESLNCDAIHFPYQDYVYCKGVPTVYNPHDLQHLHYPQFFAPEEIERREIIYEAACRAARTVVVASDFVKRDVIERYGTDAAKLQVIPWSPPEVSAEPFTAPEAAALLKKYDCPPRPFILYPAMTWEHKNHLRLLEAVHALREREGLLINVVCTGHKNSFYGKIENRVRELNLESQIRFTGIVEYKELSTFYRLARFVVVPTLFEAASAPLFEAWQHGTPVACSAVTSLPEQAADAALLFNPFSVAEIADAVKTLTLDEDLRAVYRMRGFRRLLDFSPERTANAYRAVYRKAAGETLTEEERELLN
jgi:glycosyltransferase involved in cell wall biosynthesis